MPIAPSTLAALADSFVAPMTSIRGRRIRRLLLREFASFDHVVPATAEDGRLLLLALAGDGRVAACWSDGRGEAAEVLRWRGWSTGTVAVAHELLKDSLPVVRWTLWHPGAARTLGTIVVEAREVPAIDRDAFAALLGGPA
jgi:hypothetical protein